MTGDGTVYLIDLHGEIVHTWKLPYRPGMYGYLTERGTLFYNGKVMEDLERLTAWPNWKAGAALEVDWNGRVLWQVRHPDHHHDGIRLRNGNVILLCMAELPQGVANRVQGGRPGSEFQGKMFADYLVEMTTSGKTVWEWRSWEHLEPEVDVITAAQELREEWTHGNTVGELPDGNLVLSFRHISTVAVIDRKTGDIVWKLGAPPLAQQHAPVLLANGNFLIFDNGTHRVDAHLPFSRVIEVDPTSNRIVWYYQERRPIDFFSPNISNAQRLPNGNTLICEGAFGRLFEVTHECDVVWEYVSPYFGELNGAIHNSVFRAFRYSEEEVDRARATV